jgi:hypothetical protein
MLGAGTQHFLDIDFVAWSPLELPPGHVADDGGMRIGFCAGHVHAMRVSVVRNRTAPVRSVRDRS